MSNSGTKTSYPTSLLAITTAGLVTGTLQVVLSSSYAALIYSGKLSPYVSQGIGFALTGALVIATIITLFAALPGTVGSNQDVSVAIFSLISASIMTTMPPHASLESVFCTVVTAIALTVLLTGIFFWVLGTFHLGGLIRYFPYPVVGGFLAGTGWLLFKGGFTLTTGSWSYSALLHPYYLARWLPGICFAILLLVSIRLSKNNSLLAGAVILGILLFYGTTSSLGMSPEELSADGWLLGPFPQQTLWQPLTLARFKMVDWSAIAFQTANITTVLTVSSIALLLNASAFEIESRQDVNLDQELRLAGVANVCSCFFPGFVGFRQLSLTVLNYRMNAQHRMVGLIGVMVIALTLFFGTSILSYFPKIIMGGLLMYLGFTFLFEWAFETWFTLPTIDFFIIWLVLIVIATVGFIPGVGVGLFAAVIMFVVSYSRTEVVRHEFTGKSYQSLRPRRSDHRQILDAQGDSLYILQLQGYIFFGTANRLFKKIKERLSNPVHPTARYIVLDFQRVEILDSTGMLSFKKLKNVTNTSHIHLVVTAPSPTIQKQLEKGGLYASDPLTHYFPSLNAGIEWCEGQVLRQATTQETCPLSLQQQLQAAIPNQFDITLLLQHVERLEIRPGTTIIFRGKPIDAFFFIESGQVTTTKKNFRHPSADMETIKNGRFLGEVGFYLGHTSAVDVVAAEQCILYRFSLARLKQLEKEHPAITSLLHEIMVRLLADRITHLTKKVTILQE